MRSRRRIRPVPIAGRANQTLLETLTIADFGFIVATLEIVILQSARLGIVLDPAYPNAASLTRNTPNRSLGMVSDPTYKRATSKVVARLPRTRIVNHLNLESRQARNILRSHSFVGWI